MNSKKESRQRRAKRTRAKIRALEAVRLTVNKTGRHMYAQVMTSSGDKTLVSASTLDKELKDKLKVTSNADAAKEVGKLIATRALAAGVKNVAFDRSGFAYHGRVKALADAARETGLEF
jgi:large subunit ribosomal protein L18